MVLRFAFVVLTEIGLVFCVARVHLVNVTVNQRILLAKRCQKYTLYFWSCAENACLVINGSINGSEIRFVLVVLKI